jgi:hypothetical protein
MKDVKMKAQNFVAKHAHKFCRASVQVDRRKAERAGYKKHKKPLTE